METVTESVFAVRIENPPGSSLGALLSDIPEARVYGFRAWPFGPSRNDMLRETAVNRLNRTTGIVPSVVENNIEQGRVNGQFAIVFNKAQLAKLVHEETDPGAGGADHL